METVNERKQAACLQGWPLQAGPFEHAFPCLLSPVAVAPFASLESFPSFPASHCPLNPNQSDSVHLASILLSVVQERSGQKAVCNVREKAEQSGGHVREPQKRYHNLSSVIFILAFLITTRGKRGPLSLVAFIILCP